MKGQRHSSSFQSEPASVNQSEPCTSPSKPTTCNQSEPSNQSIWRDRRGTRLRQIALSDSVGKKIPIEFDEYWKPIGPNASRYRSFVGLLACNKPSILIEEWINIDDRVKQHIWDTIQLTYDVPQSDILYKKTMMYCCERWSKFKTNLANKYVHIKVKDGEPHPNPCNKYSYLNKEIWQEFCRIQTTPKALQKKEKTQENDRKNDYPHTMSCEGCGKAENDLIATKRKRLEEAQSNPYVLLSPPSSIRHKESRKEKWLYADQRKSGSYTSEQTRVVVEKIELQKTQVDGSFRSVGRNDILTVATGKHKHPGRVRGVEGGVGIRDYFGEAPRHSSSMVTREEMEHRLATVMAEIEAKREASFAILKAQFSKMKEEIMMIVSTRQENNVPQAHSLSPIQSSIGSCCISRQSSEGGIQIAEPCDLFVKDPHRRLVTCGVSTTCDQLSTTEK